MANVFVTGANRGIGLEFVRRLAKRGGHVFAGVRQPQHADKLREMRDEHDNIHIIPLDMAELSSITAAVASVQGRVDQIDLLINNAGTNPSEGALDNIDPESAVHTFRTNALGPMLLVRAMRPLLKAGAKVVNISSGAGSLTQAEGRQNYSYGASKAALNMYNRSLATELRFSNIISIVMDPGWVQTDMGGPQAGMTVIESVGAQLHVIDHLTPDDSGKFFHYSGEQVPW